MDCYMETQTFDTQSDFELKVWIGNEANEDLSTESFGDTVPLGGPSEETRVDNIDSYNEMIYDYEVVLDRDDGGVHNTETACSKELTSGELKRTAGGDVLDTPCLNSKDFVVGSVASDHKQCEM